MEKIKYRSINEIMPIGDSYLLYEGERVYNLIDRDTAINSALTYANQQTSTKDARIKELEARLETDDNFRFDLIPLPVSFLEWVSHEKWQRLHESVGHKWFKKEVFETYTTIELYNFFVNEMNQESTHS